MIPNQWYVVMDSEQVGEKLIQGDRPIVEYRRRRQELLDKAARPFTPD